MPAKKPIRRLSIVTAVVLTAATVAAATTSTPPGVHPAAPADPTKVLGNDACIKCHAAEIDVWRRTPHADTFRTLHRKPEARAIAAKLGLQSIKHGGRCTDCHYTTQIAAGGSPNLGNLGNSPHHAAVIDGISCESCHGAAADWVDLHADYGGPGITRQTEDPRHRRWRIDASIARGMRNPTNVYLVAQSCLRCHTTGDEELVNVGGHTAGSLDFEFVSWSQGTIRHNFVRTDGQTNAAASPAQRRVMFVAGMMAELEAGLRATAVATEKSTYGITSAQRTARTIKRLQSVHNKIDSPHVRDAINVAGKVRLKLRNRSELTAAADQIATIGTALGQTATGQTWSALDPYIPTTAK